MFSAVLNVLLPSAAALTVLLLPVAMLSHGCDSGLSVDPCTTYLWFISVCLLCNLFFSLTMHGYMLCPGVTFLWYFLLEWHFGIYHSYCLMRTRYFFLSVVCLSRSSESPSPVLFGGMSWGGRHTDASDSCLPEISKNLLVFFLFCFFCLCHVFSLLPAGVVGMGWVCSPWACSSHFPQYTCTRFDRLRSECAFANSYFCLVELLMYCLPASCTLPPPKISWTLTSKLFVKIHASCLACYLQDLVHLDHVGFVPTREARHNATRVLNLLHQHKSYALYLY